jgi:hypothetical protein
MIIIPLWFAVAVATAILAEIKGRTGLGWFLLGLLFSLFALLVIFCLPTLKHHVGHASGPGPINMSGRANLSIAFGATGLARLAKGLLLAGLLLGLATWATRQQPTAPQRVEPASKGGGSILHKASQ